MSGCEHPRKSFQFAVDGGHSEEHFMTILHIRSLDAETLASAITSYVESQGLNIKRLIGQGYDGAAPFSGKNRGESVPFLAMHCISIAPVIAFS